jgi:hypothetical protein
MGRTGGPAGHQQNGGVGKEVPEMPAAPGAVAIRRSGGNIGLAASFLHCKSSYISAIRPTGWLEELGRGVAGFCP